MEDVSQITIVEPPPPEAPTPPSAVPNVFDFYVGSETPNPSTINLAAQSGRLLLSASAAADPHSPSPTTSGPGALVRFSQLENGSTEELVQYGTGPVPADFRTPAPKERKSKPKDKDASSSAVKSDKKRKRLHVDTSASPSEDRDLEMTDAPALLHSGLTGGLQKMMTRGDGFPPSPDYSGDNHVEQSPGSPVKRSKRVKERKHEVGLGTAIMQMITTTKKPTRKSSGSKEKKTTRKDDKDDDDERPRKQHRKSKRRESGPKMIEYKPSAQDGSQTVVVYKGGEGAADLPALLLGFVDKGPASERGVSMNKALKRYHRSRAAAGQQGQGRSREEKELWKRLRMRRNEAGEVVLFF